MATLKRSNKDEEQPNGSGEHKRAQDRWLFLASLVFGRPACFGLRACRISLVMDANQQATGA